ncbi:hypothetical protein niasHT_026123 [Heterodera trifolii]|uniref:polynucleotide adenylyltransferase n=1 Tax=Heterodera trifolii TaxID=157864 RepID=A0ABD2KR13_9BILA
MFQKLQFTEYYSPTEETFGNLSSSECEEEIFKDTKETNEEKEKEEEEEEEIKEKEEKEIEKEKEEKEIEKEKEEKEIEKEKEEKEIEKEERVWKSNYNYCDNWIEKRKWPKKKKGKTKKEKEKGKKREKAWKSEQKKEEKPKAKSKKKNVKETLDQKWEQMEEKSELKNEEKPKKAKKKRMVIKKLADLLNDFLLANLYVFYLQNELKAEKYLEYLHISMFVRTTNAKMKFVKMHLTDFKTVEKLNEFWRTFLNGELKKKEQNSHFVMEKLLMMQNELDKFILTTEEKGIETFYNGEEMQKSVEIGTFGNGTVGTMLSQLHLHSFSSLKAKQLINSEEFASIGKMDEEKMKGIFNGEKIGQRKIEKYAKAMETVLKQHKLGKKCLPNIEQSQYNLIRTEPKLRENDRTISEEIYQFILKHSVNSFKRGQILELKDKIEQTIGEWVVKMSAKRTDAHLLVNGSHLMSTEVDGSDLDLICVLSDELNLNGQIDTNLFSLLGMALNGAKITLITGRVQLVRIIYANIEVDLIFVPVPRIYFSTDSFDSKFLGSDQIVGEITSENGIFALAGYRSCKFQLSLVQDQKVLFDLVKAVKIWAKNRLIYSSIFGFFNGAILATKICALFPNAPLSFLLFQFFSIFSQWDWPNVPVELEPLNAVSLNPIVCLWPPPKIGKSNLEKQMANCGYQRKKIRWKFFEWANSEKVAEKLEHYHQIPQLERTTRGKNLKGKNAFCTVWVAGLVMKDENGDVQNFPPIYSPNSNGSFNSSYLMHSLFFTDAQQMNENEKFNAFV